MCNHLLNKVASILSELKALNKITVFSIATTAKQEDESYLTPVRVSSDFCLVGCVVFDQKILLPLLEQIDGIVDIILVDSEKKMPLRLVSDVRGNTEPQETVGYVETGNISKICFQNIKKSKVFEFKPNDLTVNAVWSFLSQRLHFLSGKKISILGAGNVGSKLALKLVECGVEVHLHRRDVYRGYQVTQGLNLIKPENTVANIQFQQNIIQASFMSDVLIGACGGYPIIDKRVVRSVKKKCLIVDLGKNNLTKEAIQLATRHSMELYRADVTPALESYIYEVLKMQDILEKSYGKKNLNYCNIVGGGYFGGIGDVVVNQIHNPTLILGVSAGNGSLKKVLNSEDRFNLKQLKKEFNIEN